MEEFYQGFLHVSRWWVVPLAMGCKGHYFKYLRIDSFNARVISL